MLAFGAAPALAHPALGPVPGRVKAGGANTTVSARVVHDGDTFTVTLTSNV